MPKRRPWRTIVGIGITAAVFALVCLALSEQLGWPSSPLTFGAMLVAAWIAGALVGKRITTIKISAVTSCVLVILIALSTIGFGQPWNLGLWQEGKEETVHFYWKASFAYLGSEDNAALDNLVIFFPTPTVENDVIASPIIVPPAWTLYFQDEEGWHVQATHLHQYKLMGKRAKFGATIGILNQGLQRTYAGPVLLT